MPDSTLRRVLYVSLAAPDLSGPDVEALVRQAEANNARDEITGFLLFNGRNFMQLFEGPDDRVVELLDKLLADERHSGLVVLQDSVEHDRACPDWRMRRLALLHGNGTRRADMEATLPSAIDGEARRIVLNFASLS